MLSRIIRLGHGDTFR